MFAGLNGAYGVGTGVPPLSPEREKELALEALQKAARGHTAAIQEALQVPGVQEVPQHMVDAIVKAGGDLDRALGFAARRGATPREMAETADLHPSYVRELLREAENWPI